MSFKKLYDFCNTLDIPVSRSNLKAKLLEVTEKQKLAITVSSQLNPRDVRGMFLSVECDNLWVRQHGSDVVVLSRAIYHKSDTGNYCWERFIIVKEMMHLFDEPGEYSDSGEKFDEILSALFMTYQGASEVVNSEVKCFWRALACLCPETLRADFSQKVLAGNLTNLDVALKLKIPEQYVGHLLSDRFSDYRDELIS